MPKFIIFVAFIAILGASCQYSVKKSKLPELQQFLVINADLTEQYGRVLISYTLSELTPQGGYVFPPPPVATAYVEDSQGNRFSFDPSGVEDYSFKGKVGETYQLFVTADGQSYVSEKETMRACPEIDSLTPNYAREAFRSPDDLLYDGFDVYAHFQDKPNEENFYQWDWVHYERTEACALETINGLVYKIPCSPYDCWGIYPNQRVIVQSDLLRDGASIAKKVTRVPYATPPQRYYIRVEQRSLTPSVFAYQKSLETQTQGSGSIFDVPAQTKLNPNVKNTDDPSEQILGVFSVFSSRYKILIINMQQSIPGATPKSTANLIPWTPTPLLQAECVESATRTLIRPEGWVD
jgi:Domain of unknown function (DUF4249)